MDITETGEAEVVAEYVAQQEESVEVEAQPEPEATEEPAEPKTLREALEQNFDKKETKEEPEEAKPEEKEAEVKAESEEKAEEEAPIIAPPADMKAEEKEAFAKLPADMQQYISRRAYETRNHLSQKSMEIAEQSKTLGALSEVVSEVRDEYARKGVDVTDVVRRAVAWDKAIEANPYGALRQFLDAHGVHPSDLIGEDGDFQEVATPQQQITEADIDKLVEQKLAMREQSATVAEKQTAVESFLGSKPVFKDPGTAQLIEAEMAPVLAAMYQAQPSANYADLLEKAYNYTLKNSEALAPIYASLTAKETAERTTKEATKAKKASRSISGGPSSGSPKRKHASTRESLEAYWDGSL